MADLLHVRGMLDYTAVLDPSREELLDMIASTNEAHGTVILLSAEAATRENRPENRPGSGSDLNQ